MDQNKLTMFEEGCKLIERFCIANSLTVPPVHVVPSSEWHFRECAYYRPIYINICLEKCASIGQTGPAWSYPGYVADRTPYGVLAHELGHHADRTRSTRTGAYFGDYSLETRRAANEPRLTGYCPNDAEWFAEHFRLFVTNPDLLRLIRPRTFALLVVDFRPVPQLNVSAAVNEHGLTPWEHVLHDAPGRTLRQTRRKIEAAAAGQLV